MSFVLKNVSKSYIQNKKEIKVLKNINLVFPDKGIVFITGKSGSGKTTLMNLMTRIDKQSSGEIFYQGINISKLNEKKLCLFRNQEIGIVFQHFNLLMGETVLENILLPKAIGDKSGENEELNALLHQVGFNKTILLKRVKDLSGGEKQRVAIIRSLINNPNVIFADEPTGALDTNNSKSVMNILKDISKNRLVIVVSHNKQIISEFSDYTIELEDGKILNPNLSVGSYTNKTNWNKKKLKGNSKWTYRFGLQKLKKQKTKTVVSALSIFVSFVSSLLILGFMMGSKESALIEGKKQLEYGVMSVSHESKRNSGSSLGIVKQRRPTKEEIEHLTTLYPETIFDYDFSFFINQNSEVSFNSKILESIVFQPIFSYEETYFNSLLVLEGNKKPKEINASIYINESCYKILKNLGFEGFSNPLLNLTISSKIDTNIEGLQGISGYFEHNSQLFIEGIVKDFSFLTSPKIYYSYSYFKDVFLNSYFDVDQTMNVYELIENVSPFDPISSYKIIAFNKFDESEDYINKIIKENELSLKFVSEPHIRIDSFIDLLEASSIGLSLFLIIAILGTVLIIGILAFSTYSQDKKDIAILYTLGANKEQVLDIYLTSNLLISILSIVAAILLSPLLTTLMNMLLEYFLGTPNLITNFLYPFSIGNIGILLLIFLAGLVVSFLSISIPLVFGSGVNLKEELKCD